MGSTYIKSSPPAVRGSLSSVIVTFSGAIGSGKSTLSRAIAKRLGFSRVSFGDHVKLIAGQRGIAQTRESLQEVGVSLIEAGWEGFCRSVLSQASWKVGQSLVVDGVRHVEALQTLRRITAPSRVVSVFVRLSESERKSRFEQAGTPNAPLVQWASHSTEIQTGTMLPEVADLILDGSQPLEEEADRVEQWIDSLAGEEV